MVTSGTTVLLLPGLLCDAGVWEPQIAALTGARCVVPDYRAADSIVRMAEIALAATPGPVSVAGHSMGGRVALEVARLAPERVERLALLDTGYQGRPAGPAGEKERRERERLVAIARTQGMRAMGSDWVRGMVRPDRLVDAGLVNRILAMIERQPLDCYVGQVQALLSRPDATDVLRSLRCAVLIGCGREDTWSPLARHEEMASLVPDATLAVFDGCGHMSTFEQPAAVAQSLRQWLHMK